LGVETVCSVRAERLNSPEDQDQVIRKERFCEHHPSVRIYTDSTVGLRAEYPDPSGDGGLKTTVGYTELKYLLDFLERVLE
jgi:hypothetical protein